ncbi:MAG: hypothetical protein U0230_01610 [Polyangiales bacterium]
MRRLALAAFALFLAASAPARADDGADAGAEVAEAGADAPQLHEEAHVQEDILTEVQVGTYVNRLREIDLKNGTFEVDFWIWFRWRGTEVRPDQSFEVVNGRIEDRTEGEILDDQGFNYASSRVRATIFHVFDAARFPYDEHTIELRIEDKENEDHRIRYVPDVASAGIDPEVDLAEWNVVTLRPVVASFTYHSNYGFRSLGTSESKYSRYRHPLHLTRAGRGKLFKLFWVSYLAVLLALLALRVRVTDLDARFGLGVGSIFAATANTYVLGDVLPDSDRITLAEQVNLLAVVAIFASLFVSVASLRLTYAGREEASEKLDRHALVVFSVLYLAANLFVLWR